MKHRLFVVVESIIAPGSWVKSRESGCTKVTIAGIDCFWWRNGKMYSVTEMTTGGMAGDGFTLDEAMVTAEINFTSGKWDESLIKAKKILQEHGIGYPVNATKKHPVV